MIRLATYANDKMTISMDRCLESSLKYGVDVATGYRPEDLGDDFLVDNEETICKERGGGYWLWKPYIINRRMRLIEDGSILIYSDAGVEFINNVKHIIDRMDEDIFFFTNGHNHFEWCKADVIQAINGINVRDYLMSDSWPQVQASVIFFKVNQKTRDFVKEWLLYSQMPGFIDDSPSKLLNYPTFAEHRHDQAILTCLQYKYGYKLHWWPTQYSDHIRVPGDSYPVMFNHHRLRNNEYKSQCV